MQSWRRSKAGAYEVCSNFSFGFGLSFWDVSGLSSMLAIELWSIGISLCGLICGSLIVYYISNPIAECNMFVTFKFKSPLLTC